MRIRPHPPESRVRELLERAGLPTADLTLAHLQHFFGCGARDTPDGVVGVELHGADALLRSLAVAKVARGKGCGAALVANAERHAREHGAKHMYLLTTTAARFFEKLGYRPLPRDEVPQTIRSTKEFASLCPSTAVTMHKELPDPGDLSH